ncbi:MAG TPA: hypothetical protein VK324_16575, partial [Tepidisphaeraceae bacterium]|nr:hypothetical protein [Tepidisphaeraceae bacterium]
LLRLADEPPTVAPPVPPRSSAPVGRSVVPARAALPPIEHADVPAASDEESFDLYDLADDAAGKVAHAEAEPIAELPPVSRTSLKPAAAPMARAGPAGGAGAMRTTKSGAVLVGGRRPLNYASAADGDGQRTLGEADIDWVMRLRNASTLMVWTININFLATWFTFGIDMLEGGAAMAVAVMNVAASWLLTCREPEAHESVGWTIVRVALRAFASLTFVGEVSIAIGTFGIANPLGAWGYLLMGATIPATALFLLYLWKLATRIPNKPLAVNVLIVMIGLTGVLIGTVGGVAFGAASGSAGTAIFAGIAGIVLLIVFRIWYLGLLIWFNRSFS